MPPRPRGSIVEPRKPGGQYAIRFRVPGHPRQFQTTNATTRAEAEVELENVLADVRRGLWRPSARAPVVEAPKEEPTFHVFASEWLAARQAEGLEPKTIVDLRWSLELHLLPRFADYRLSAITAQEIDRYKVAKAAERSEIEKRREAAEARGERFGERGLSNSSINHTLRHLSQVLEAATEYGLIDSNPATGRRRRLKASKPARPWVEPEQLPSLLDAGRGNGKLLLEILAGAGLRIGEALALRWPHVDLGTGTLHVVAAKTEKGVREVHLTPALREALTLARVDSKTTPDGLVIATSTGKKCSPSNLRRDVLAPAVKAANAELEKLGIARIGRVTFHSLRRTYASLRCACGDDVRYTADQLGHEDPRFTLRVYAQATKRRDRMAEPHRKQYDRALEWASMQAHDVFVKESGAEKEATLWASSTR
jgi:integrase